MLFLEKMHDLLMLLLGCLSLDNFLGWFFLVIVSSLPLYFLLMIILDFYNLLGGNYERKAYSFKRRH